MMQNNNMGTYYVYKILILDNGKMDSMTNGGMPERRKVKVTTTVCTEYTKSVEEKYINI